MSTPIYSDKDYLDEQFRQITERFDRHDKAHEDAKATLIRYAGLILTAAGVVAGFVSAH